MFPLIYIEAICDRFNMLHTKFFYSFAVVIIPGKKENASAGLSANLELNNLVYLLVYCFFITVIILVILITTATAIIFCMLIGICCFFGWLVGEDIV